MQLIHATEAQRQQSGESRVLVGVIDTGVDGTHPDIAPNFSKSLSRNFVRDIPTDPAGNELDGPCEFASCVDPVDHDDDGHGTHVASTIASPINGQGIAGVAPDVTLVNIRAGQDSGYFFLAPTLDAMTYAGDAGIDVVNMSFYTDPWLFNCAANPADSPAEQEEQRVIITATQRAVELLLRPRHHVHRGGRQREHRPLQAERRRDQPGLPRGDEDAGVRQAAPDRPEDVPERADPDEPRDQRGRRRDRPSACPSTATTARARSTSPPPVVTPATTSAVRRARCSPPSR